jgi:hypothetical protein
MVNGIYKIYKEKTSLKFRQLRSIEAFVLVANLNLKDRVF